MDPTLPTDPRESRFLVSLVSGRCGFSTSVGIAGRGATDALLGGATETSSSPNVIRDIEYRRETCRVFLDTGVSAATVFVFAGPGGPFCALPSIIVAIVALSDASSVDALSRPRELLFFISDLRRSTPARIFEKLIFPAASVISRILLLGVAAAAALAAAAVATANKSNALEPLYGRRAPLGIQSSPALLWIEGEVDRVGVSVVLLQTLP